jgi:hypothetical protein
MPQPYWTFFAIAVALIAVLEWEEVSGGHVPRSLLGHIGFALTPVVYVALAAWIFVAWPLVYAEKIRSAAAAICSNHRGLDESGVRIVYAGHRYRSGRLHGGPPHDQITVRCNDGYGGFGEYTPDGLNISSALAPDPRDQASLPDVFSNSAQAGAPNLSRHFV